MVWTSIPPEKMLKSETIELELTCGQGFGSAVPAPTSGESGESGESRESGESAGEFQETQKVSKVQRFQHLWPENGNPF